MWDMDDLDDLDDVVISLPMIKHVIKAGQKKETLCESLGIRSYYELPPHDLPSKKSGI